MKYEYIVSTVDEIRKRYSESANNRLTNKVPCGRINTTNGRLDGGPGSGPPEGNQNAYKGGSKESEGKEKEETSESTVTSVKSNNPSEFRDTITAARNSRAEDNRWRVDVHPVESTKWETGYADMTNYTTPGGSTYSIKEDGDIVSVCQKAGDSARGKDLMAEAVKNGGTKLDSYGGNHGFYQKCGFEAVSWCKWDDEYAPADWCRTNGLDPDNRDSWKGISDSKLSQAREDIVFYKYVGSNARKESLDEFKSRVSASPQYDDAQAERDKSMKK